MGKGVEGEIGNTPQLDRTGEKKKLVESPQLEQER